MSREYKKAVARAIKGVLDIDEKGRLPSGMEETPDRVVKAYQELLSGYKTDLGSLVKLFPADGYDQIVLLKDIEMYSLCEHHILPFFGKAHVAYIPDKHVIGISKLARIVDAFAHRFQIQERLGRQVVDFIQESLQPKGAACIISAEHLCIRMRGVGKQNSIMTTSALSGVFMRNDAFGTSARNELMSLIRMG